MCSSDLCDAVFAWSFYSQGTKDQTAPSSDLFLKDALTFFGDPAMAASALGAFDKGRRLAQLIGDRRSLLILDGLEPLQYAPTSPLAGELKDPGLAALLKGLATRNGGLCVITTRYSVRDLQGFRQTTAPMVSLSRLSNEAGVALLRSLGVLGSLQEFEKLVEDVKGHALTLNLIGMWLRFAHAGDIRKCNLLSLGEMDCFLQGGHAFHVMDAYVRWLESTADSGSCPLSVLRLMGLFDRPATADCLAALLQPPAISDLTEALVESSEAQRNMALTQLEDAKLLTVSRDPAGSLVSLDTHPLLREYFAQKVLGENPNAWMAAHRRLFEHLCATTPDNPNPKLEDLQPLYQAVAHACHAGMQEEAALNVYHDRIQRGNENYSLKKLGAFGSALGALACFFEAPWSRISTRLTAAQQGWLLNEAAFCLRATVRLPESIEPMRAACEKAMRLGDWGNTASGYGNLSDLELILGDVAGAVADAEKAIAYADRDNDSFKRMTQRTNYANAMHQAGQRADAERCFREAESLQAEMQPHLPRLYSAAGFMYCDLLLAPVESAAWQLTLDPSSIPQAASVTEVSVRVSERATEMLRIAGRNRWLLHIALADLTFGRSALYNAILEASPPDRCGLPIQRAVDGLRRAGQIQFVPFSLLTRAWWYSLAGNNACVGSASDDLDEACEIAERGSMPLFLADIHLHRARLFGRMQNNGGKIKYPWESPHKDLAEARRLIEKHGYGRRQQELEDAERVLL